MKDVVKFRVLVGVARSDGDFDQKEKEFIKHLADLQGLSGPDFKKLVQEGEKTSNLIKELSYDDKVDILIYMVKLMKIDGKVLLSELTFGERVAKSLGFEEKCIGFLSGIIDGNPDEAPLVSRINHRMRKYLVE